MRKTDFILAILLTALFTACTATPETAEPTATNRPEALFTQAAQTAAARTTLTAQVTAPPQDTPEPTATPEPTDTPVPSATSTPESAASPTETPVPSTAGGNCDSSVFVSDVTVPDGKLFDPGEDFTKTWQIANDGSCTWTSEYSLRFVEGAQMSAESPQAMVIDVAAGTLVDISVFMMAPDTPGSHTGYWQMYNANDEPFGNRIYVEIEVTGAGETETPAEGSATATTEDPTAPVEVTETPLETATETPTETVTP